MSNGHLNSNIISYFIVCIFYISKHDRDRVTLLRLRAFVICMHIYLTCDNLIFVHAIFLPCATLCACILIACVQKIFTVYSIMSTHLNYLNYNKLYSHENKKYIRVFLLFSLCFLESSCISSKFGCSLRSHIKKELCLNLSFFFQNDEKLVFWYCSSFFCPFDLSGLRDTDTRAKSLSSITCHRKFSQLRHDGGQNTFHAVTQQPTGFWPKTMYSLKAHGAPDTPNSLFGAALRSIT